VPAACYSLTCYNSLQEGTWKWLSLEKDYDDKEEVYCFNENDGKMNKEPYVCTKLGNGCLNYDKKMNKGPYVCTEICDYMQQIDV
jgi:hypothetical protein